jgi:hypothetical protein
LVWLIPAHCVAWALPLLIPIHPLLPAQELLFEAKGANCVAWNADYDDMLAFSGGGQMSIFTAGLPPITQKMNGFVVGFKVRPSPPWGSDAQTLSS